MNRLTLGAQGEKWAAEYLRNKGYTIIATNWHCVRGELDIIAQDGDILVFIEVKTRRSAHIADALVSITPRKRERLIASAYTYIADERSDEPDWRIDVIAVALPTTGEPVIAHVEDALGW